MDVRLELTGKWDGSVGAQLKPPWTYALSREHQLNMQQVDGGHACLCVFGGADPDLDMVHGALCNNGHLAAQDVEIISFRKASVTACVGGEEGRKNETERASG
eukprot:365989-Chlamydomonas_euryale.AAC.5